MSGVKSGPVLSIVTPVYNGERFIASCIESVAEQHCDAIEHIIVDGASKDRTAEIARHYAKSLPYLTLISEPDSGQSDAQNKGIRAAKAAYVSILNVDDFYAPGALRRITELLSTLREPRFICGNCNIINEDGSVKYINTPATLKLVNIMADDDTWPYPYNPSAYFYPKALHDEIGYYEEDEHFQMDLRFILAAIQKIEPLYLNEVLGNFRLIPGTKTFVGLENGRLLVDKRAIFRQAFMRLPLNTQARVVLLWLVQRPRLAYWNFRRQLRRRRSPSPTRNQR